jgi:hypothetical protein
VRIGAYYSHLNGLEWLMVRRPGVWEEINEIISRIDAEECRTKVSKEKTMFGKMLFSPDHLNRRFNEEFGALDWHEEVTRYWVTDDHDLIRHTVGLPPAEQRAEIRAAGKVAIASYNQTDFVKNRVAVEVQLGKYSFIAYDLFVKHMAFFVGNRIDLGIEILATKAMQAQMSSGPGYYENALYSIVRQGRGVPAVPLLLIGVEPDAGPTLAELEAASGGQIADEPGAN